MPKKKTDSASSSSDMKSFGGRIDSSLAKKLKLLSVDKDIPSYKLLEEAIIDLLKKYKAF